MQQATDTQHLLHVAEKCRPVLEVMGGGQANQSIERVWRKGPGLSGIHDSWVLTESW